MITTALMIPTCVTCPKLVASKMAFAFRSFGSEPHKNLSLKTMHAYILIGSNVFNNMLHLWTFLHVPMPTTTPDVNLTLDFCKYTSCGHCSLTSLAHVALCNCSTSEVQMASTSVGE